MTLMQSSLSIAVDMDIDIDTNPTTRSTNKHDLLHPEAHLTCLMFNSTSVRVEQEGVM